MDKKFNVWSLTWPIFIELFLRTFLGIVNTYMLSIHSDSSVAAVGVATQLVNMLVIAYNIVGFGTAILVSQNIGAGNKKRALEISSIAFYINFAFGIVMGIFFAILSKSLLNMMGIPDELVKEARVYLVIMSLFSFSQALLSTMSASVKSFGHTKISMVVAVGMNIMNIVCVYIALNQPFGIPYMGVTGVAVSTIISQLTATIVMLLILKRKLYFTPRLNDLMPIPKDIVRDLVKIGGPAAGEHFSYNLSQIVTTAIIATLGTNAIITNVYTTNIVMFIRMMTYSVGTATQIKIGYLVGSNEHDTAYKSCYKSLALGVALSFTTAIVFTLFRKGLLGLFTNDVSVIAVGSILVMMCIILDSGRALNTVFINALRGAGDVRFPVIMGVISMWGVSVTMAYVFGIKLGLGLPGVWLAFILDEWIRGGAMWLRWRSGAWRKMSFVQNG